MNVNHNKCLVYSYELYVSILSNMTVRILKYAQTLLICIYIAGKAYVRIATDHNIQRNTQHK